MSRCTTDSATRDSNVLQSAHPAGLIQCVCSFFLTVALLLSSQTIAASAVPTQSTCPVIDLSVLSDHIDTADSLCLYLAPSDETDIDDLLSNTVSWQLNQDETVNFGYKSEVFWVKAEVSGLSEIGQDAYLRLNYPHLDMVDYYLIVDGNVREHYLSGDTRTFSQRPVDHLVPLFPLTDKFGDSAQIILRLSSNGPMVIPVDIITARYLHISEKPLMIWYGVFFGIMGIMLFYNFIIFVMVRDANYLLYILYLSASAALQFALYGLGFQYLWPESTLLNNLMVPILTALMPFSAIAFVSRFVGLNRIGSRFEKNLSYLLYMGFSGLLVGTFLLPYSLVMKIVYVLSLTAISLGFYVGVKYWIKGHKEARIFALAWFFYLVFVVNYILFIIGIVPPSLVSMHSIEIGSIIEMALLSLAFADRLNVEKERRLQMQLQLNADLDQLVQQRTIALEIANKKLQRISNTDALTGLSNRGHFDKCYPEIFRDCLSRQQPLALMMLDVDHFKQINDTYGHGFGDLCLQQLAGTLQRHTPEPEGIAARYGGEEFIILLPGSDTSKAVTIAHQIMDELHRQDITDGRHHIRITASVGISVGTPTRPEDQTGFMSEADRLLYLAKKNGRDRAETARLHERITDSTV